MPVISYQWDFLRQRTNVISFGKILIFPKATYSDLQYRVINVFAEEKSKDVQPPVQDYEGASRGALKLHAVITPAEWKWLVLNLFYNPCSFFLFVCLVL